MEQVALIRCMMFLLTFQKYLFFQCFQEKLIRIAAAIAPQYVSNFTRVPPCNIEKNKIFQKHFILMKKVALIKCIMFLSKFQKYLFFQCFQEKLIRIAAAIAPQYVSNFTRVPPCNIEKNKISQKHFILMEQVALITCMMFLLTIQKYLFFQCFQEKLIRIAAAIAPQYVSIFTRVPPCNIEKNKIVQKHFILMKQVALIKCIMFLSKFQKYLFFQCFQEKLIRIAAVIAPQYVSIFTRAPLVTLRKNTIFQKHFIIIDGIGSPDHAHDVSIKILEIPLLLGFLGEVDTYRGSDSAAIRIKFYKGPPL